MGARKHRSKREELAGKPRKSADNPAGFIGKCPQFLLYVDKLNSRKRSELVRLCRLHNVSLKWEEWRDGFDSRGQSIKIGIIARVWGIPESLVPVANWVDSTLNVHSELCISSAIPRAIGSGTLSQGAEKRSRLNKHQLREYLKDGSYQRRSDAADRSERKKAHQLEQFGRAISYAQWLAQLPDDERERIERENRELAEKRKKAQPVAPFVPAREAIKPRIDCGKLPPLPESTLVELSAAALTAGLKEYWFSIVESRRIQADANKLASW